MPTYEETVAYLTGLEASAGWDLKLDRMRAAVALRGNPEAAWPAIHIAGTNGKGSTAAMVEAVLRASGHRAGLYTSPHLVDFTERIQVAGEPITREAVVGLVWELRGVMEQAGIALTYFELTTLLAFEWFRRAEVEIAVVETGLGGRLDATNVVRPIVTAITQIARDHEQYLGTGIEAIAAEKAGIIKAGVPVITGALPPDADAVVEARAVADGAPLHRAPALTETPRGLAFSGSRGVWGGIRIGVAGTFQRENAAVALAILAELPDRFACPATAVRRGLEAVRWPGRLEVLRREPLVLVDGAHNPAGVAALVRELPRILGERPVQLVFAAMGDKDWGVMLSTLAERARGVILTRVGPRGVEPARLAGVLAGRAGVERVEDAGRAVATALERAGAAGAVLVAGSLYLVGVAYGALATPGHPPRPFAPWYPSRAGATESAPCGLGGGRGERSRRRSSSRS